jgi:ribosomal-protein-alanine N-acetyltransferase
MFPIKLKGERITLREFQPEDAEARWAYVADPQVSRYQSWTYLADLEACKKMLLSDIAEAKSDSRKVYLLAAELDGKVIGEAGLVLGPAKDSKCSIFYTMKREYWDRGYATEAARMVVRFAFETLNLHRVSATVNTENASSAKITHKLGMQHEGQMREASKLFNGQWGDSDLYSLLRQEWEAQTPQ